MGRRRARRATVEGAASVVSSLRSGAIAIGPARCTSAGRSGAEREGGIPEEGKREEGSEKSEERRAKREEGRGKREMGAYMVSAYTSGSFAVIYRETYLLRSSSGHNTATSLQRVRRGRYNHQRVPSLI
ncbi:hypothetical protein B7494_g8162 [Chlorociboria aeruginascens]|nr:hypothetical protein B7494_g8162 [Chlorociboria aeruginascens]